MTITNHHDVRSHLLAQCETLVAQWQQAIARAGFTPQRPSEVRQILQDLYAQIIDLLCTEHVDSQHAASIGMALARLAYSQPRVLSCTHTVLVEHLLPGVPPAMNAVVATRLAMLLGHIAAGFAQQVRTTVLTEQEQIHGALKSERLQIEQALRQSEARFRAIFEHAAIGIGLTDMEGRFVETNRAFQQMLGYDGATLRGCSFSDVTHVDDIAADRDLYHELIRGVRHCYQLKKRYLHRRGEVVWAHLTVSLVYDAAGQPVYAIGMVENITEACQTKRALDRAQQRLAERQEAERLHLARELHDSTVQRLLAVSYQLAALQQRTHGDAVAQQTNNHAAASIETIRQDVLAVVGQLRGVIGELRPAGLSELGLSTALEGYVARLQRESGATLPTITLDLAPIDTTMPLPIAVCLFRVAQEALRNAITHAHARSITVKLQVSAEDACVEVRDDGVGFRVPPRLKEFVLTNQYGIVGMAERVAALNGVFCADARPSGGTAIIARVPLRRIEDADG